MYLKITSPEAKIYEWEIKKITIPTEAGEITVLPGHEPLSSIVKAGLVKVTPQELPSKEDFVIGDDVFHVAVTKGIVFIDGERVVMTTSAATTTPAESQEVLENMKKEMQDQLEKIKVEGNVEDFEQAMLNLEKVTADLRLSKLKGVSSK